MSRNTSRGTQPAQDGSAVKSEWLTHVQVEKVSNTVVRKISDHNGPKAQVV